MSLIKDENGYRYIPFRDVSSLSLAKVCFSVEGFSFFKCFPKGDSLGSALLKVVEDKGGGLFSRLNVDEVEVSVREVFDEGCCSDSDLEECYFPNGYFDFTESDGVNFSGSAGVSILLKNVDFVDFLDNVSMLKEIIVCFPDVDFESGVDYALAKRTEFIFRSE